MTDKTKASDLVAGDIVRDEYGIKRRVREILPSWYKGYLHLVWGPNKTENIIQVRKTTKIVFIDGAWEAIDRL